MQSPRITHSQEKHFIGIQLSMSLSDNRTYDLWRNFMPKRKEIQGTVGEELYSIEIYPKDYFKLFKPTALFQKWAAVEVKIAEEVPAGMETLVSPEGLYAVFIHKGPANEGPKTYQYIFNVWLPQSEYQLDDRPHFAVMGEKYKNDDPESEEEIWLPIAEK